MITDRAGAHIESAQRALQERRWADALSALDAIPVAARAAESHNLRGRALVGLGRRAEAREAFRAAIAAAPADSRPRSNLALLLRDEGAVDEAIDLLEQALELSGPNARTYANLANTLVVAGRAAEAEAAYRRALELERGVPALLGLARLLARAERYAEATDHFVEAALSSPVRMELLVELANAAEPARALERACRELLPLASGASSLEQARTLARFGASYAEWQLAEVAARRGAALDEADAECVLIWSRATARRGELAGAEQLLATAAPRLDKPSLWVEWAQLAGQLRGAERSEQILTEAVAANPHSGVLLAHLAAAKIERGQLGEGEALLREALVHAPTNAAALNALAGSRLNFRRHEEALAGFERLVALHPLRPEHHSNLVFMRHYVDTPAEVLSSAHRAFADKFEWARPIARSSLGADPERRIRVAYLSSDFFDHSVARFIEPILRAHDRSSFEVHCFATVAKSDEVTARLRSLELHWHDVSGMGDAAIARSIAAASIDVLVDLAGHTSQNHLRCFAYRPAPVAFTYLGYPDTTGLRCIDYRLTDGVVDPEGEADTLASERLVRLPHTAWCYDPGVEVPIDDRDDGPITFVSFNALHKVTDRALSAWSRILRRVPGSVLAFKSWALGEPEVQAALLADCEAHGIDRDRVLVRGFAPTRREHLAMLGAGDVALDTFPYNGTTTTCDALWMGVPVVTLRGRVHAARVSESLLRALGLEELVAEDLDGYVERAVSLATDGARRRRLRAELRSRFAASPLGSPAAFMPGYEARLREAWREHCRELRAGLAPRTGELVVPVGGDVRMFVAGDVTRAPTFVLVEHQGWPEPELEASCALLEAGDSAIDLGSGTGVYALRWAAAALERTSDAPGSVLAVDADEAALARLGRSADARGFGHLSVERATSSTWHPDATAEAPRLARLSAAFVPRLEQLRARWPATSFVVELGVEAESRQRTLELLAELGGALRWMPSLALFAPIERELPCDESVSAAFLPPLRREAWAERLASRVLAQAPAPVVRPAWAATAIAEAIEEARSDRRPARERYAMLCELAEATAAARTVSERLHHACARAELGEYRAAARALEPLLGQVGELAPPEPMAPLLVRYGAPLTPRTPAWLEAQVLEAWLLWSAPSIASGGVAELPKLLRLFALGFVTPLTARRLGLLAAREGMLS